MDLDLLLFRVGSRFCALPLKYVEETLRPLPIEALPETPPFVLGASVIRGAPTPVVELGVLLTGKRLEQAGRAITVKTPDGRRVALLVSAVVGCGRSDEASIQTMPPLLRDAAPGAVQTLGRLDQSLLTIFQIGRLIPEAAWSRLAQPEGSA